MKIAITGSTGLVGSALIDAWSGTHLVTRAIRGPQDSPASVWDPANNWVRPGAFDGADAIVHLAGASIGSGRWTEKRKAELVNSRVAATRTLVKHLATLEHKPGLLVAASAVGFYGSRGDELLTEESGPGDDFLAKLCQDWERETAAARDLGIRTVILRLGVVLTEDGGALGKMLLPFKLGLGGRIGSGKQWMSWVSKADVVRGFDFAITMPGLDGVYNLTAPNPATNADFTKALASVLKRPAIFPIPPLAMKALLGSDAAEGLLLASQRAMPARLQSAGFAFTHGDVRAGLSAALGKG
ncbi:MAG: TIGR01777 family oxidoreductase [Dehalococcoidia bacterium]